MLRGLKADNETRTEAFEGFVAAARDRTKRMMDGLRYYHTSGDAARLSRSKREEAARLGRETRRRHNDEENVDVNEEIANYRRVREVVYTR